MRLIVALATKRGENGGVIVSPWVVRVHCVWSEYTAVDLAIRLENYQRIAEATLVTVEYCIDYCEHDPRTGAFSPRRKMVSYSAPEPLVMTRANKKLGDLKKYAEP